MFIGRRPFAQVEPQILRILTHAALAQNDFGTAAETIKALKQQRGPVPATGKVPHQIARALRAPANPPAGAGIPRSKLSLKEVLAKKRQKPKLAQTR